MTRTPGPSRDEIEHMRAKAPKLDLGFDKRALDPALFARLEQHFLDNFERMGKESQNPYLRTETAGLHPSLIVHDAAFNDWLLGALHAVHEAWAGRRLNLGQCFGPRVYTRGSYLQMHTDRADTHHVSSTITIAAEVDTPWPLVVEDHQGTVHEVDIQPGEMLLYEGGYLPHGRPDPAARRILRQHLRPLHGGALGLANAALFDLSDLPAR